MSKTIRPHIGRPPGPNSTKQARAIRTRELILAAAAEHFDTHAYTDAGVNPILATGNLTKGAIYFHSKEAIAQELVTDWIRTVTEVVTSTTEEHVTAAEHLTAIFGSLAQSVADDTKLRAGMKLSVEPALSDAVSFAHWVDAVADIVDAGIKAGEIPDTPTSHRLAWNLCAGTVGAAHAGVALREDIALITRIDDVVSAHIAAALAPSVFFAQ